MYSRMLEICINNLECACPSIQQIHLRNVSQENNQTKVQTDVQTSSSHFCLKRKRKFRNTLNIHQ